MYYHTSWTEYGHGPAVASRASVAEARQRWAAFSCSYTFTTQHRILTHSFGGVRHFVMAFNWEKLSKAQRDYPKPKLALSYIDKLLKKNPGNPYLTVSEIAASCDHVANT